ncbi:DMT family transporter [Streptomyces huiliensis]|uniref:DMT family transporter n=1 Tax=Streptomyces huiliensis TaxID=2876027 RepID=UPI001CBB6C68|nr:DMT family transporter [Streptomyces huiliensis]MBZ4321620.1 DMT family transporter [Streptomyces huiliensis]
MSLTSSLRLAALALLWGSNYLLIKLAGPEFAPAQILTLRLATGAAVLLAVAAARGERLPRDRRTWTRLTVAAVIANDVPYFLFAWAEQYVDSALAGTCNAAAPLFTVVVMVAAGQRRQLRGGQLAGVGIGFAGVVLLLAPWGSPGTIAATSACLVAAACYGAGFFYLGRVLGDSGHGPLALAAGQLTAATAVSLLAGPLLLRPVEADVSATAAVLALGTLGTGAAYVLNLRLIAEAGAVAASLVSYLLPLVAVVLGLLLLDEPVGWSLAVGGAAVLVGVVLGERRPARDTPAPQSTDG